MAARRQNPRLAKAAFSYTIAEAAELYGVHRQTVRQWLANGLRTIDSRRPLLIHGRQLNLFHKARRDAAGSSCGAGQIYCLSCRSPRRPAGDIADFVAVTEKVGMLSAICPDCERMMTQRVNAARLACFSAEIDVTVRPAPKPIDGSD